MIVVCGATNAIVIGCYVVLRHDLCVNIIVVDCSGLLDYLQRASAQPFRVRFIYPTPFIGFKSSLDPLHLDVYHPRIGYRVAIISKSGSVLQKQCSFECNMLSILKPGAKFSDWCRIPEKNIAAVLYGRSSMLA